MPRRRVWGQGGVRKEPSGSWAVRWSEGGRRRYKGALESKQIAERVLARILGDLASDRSGLPQDPRRFPTLGELAKYWIARREHTHRSWVDDRGRWNNHLEAHFGALRAAELDVAAVRAFVEAKLRAGTGRTNIRLCVATLSTFCTDLAERPRETAELLEWTRAAYALGSLAGLRTGEILPLDWDAVQLEVPRVEVHHQARDGELGPLKADEARILTGPWLGALAAALRPWRLRTGGKGLLFPPPNRRAVLGRVRDAPPALRRARGGDDGRRARARDDLVEALVSGDPPHVRIALGRHRPPDRAARRHPGPLDDVGDRAVCPRLGGPGRRGSAGIRGENW
jgi:integrase